jgi:hypothetical protein
LLIQLHIAESHLSLSLFNFPERVVPMISKDDMKKEKSDTRWYHSFCKTPQGAQVALQRCPILLVKQKQIQCTI